MNAFFALIEVVLAAVMLHRAVPSVMQTSKIKAANIWALGFALGLFSVDRLAAFISNSSLTFTCAMAHLMLITYAVLRYMSIAKRGLSFWGHKQQC